MRLAASTVAFPGIALADLPAHAQALGIDGLAVTAGARGSLAPNASPSDIDAFRIGCRERNIRVSAVYGYAGRALLADPAVRQQDLDQARRCLDLAAQFEAPLCRLFAGVGKPQDDLIDRFVAACEPIARHAASVGVRIGLPTHHDLAFDPPSCRRLIDGLGRDRAGIIFNGPSLQLDGIDPLTALHDMIDLVEQVELKDWRRIDGHEAPVPLGSGEATVWPIVEALAAAEFQGWITLHHLKQHHPQMPDLSAEAAAMVRKISHRREHR